METEATTGAATATATTTGRGRKFRFKVIGVGGGGGNAVDHLAHQALDGVEFLAINTDEQALLNLGRAERVTLGATVTHGLGTGGDPERGCAAAEADGERLRELCAGADIVCVVAGLGGGTGTGAGPVVARIAREAGALVLGMVTLPFEFEGARRQRQAQLGLRDLKAAADGVICLPNQRVMTLLDEKTPMREAFQFANQLLGEGARSLWRLLGQTGLINVDFNDLCAVVRGRHEENLLATVEAAGENRAHEAVEKLANHPLLDDGQVLAEADTVLVSLAGGPDLTMTEVNRVMEQINRQCENAHIIMGAAIQDSLAGRLAITLVAARPGARSARASARPGAAAEGARSEDEREMINPPADRRPASRFVAPAPVLSAEETEKLLTQAARGAGRARRKGHGMLQGQLPLEIISRGRFEKSEPTIHHGEDLDVPTYIRRGVALN